MRKQLLTVILPLLLLVLAASAAETPAVKLSELQRVNVVRSADDIRVEISSRGDLTPKLSTLDSPARVVVDLPGTVMATGQSHITVGSGGVKGILIGRNGQSTTTTRVVVDLDRACAYELKPSTDGKLVLTLHRPGPDRNAGTSASSAAAKVSPIRAAKVSWPISAPVIEAKAQPAPAVTATIPATGQTDAVVKTAATPSGYVFVEPRYQPKKNEPAAAATVPVERAQEAAAKFAEKTAVKLLPVSVNAAQTANTGIQPAVNLAAEQKAQSGQQPASNGPKYTGEPISVNLKDVDLKDFFRLIHEISGLNVVLDPNVHGSLTIVLDDVPWDQALDIVLKNNELARELDGNVLRVATLETLKKEADSRRAQQEAQMMAVEKVTVTRFLSYAHSKDVVPTIKKFLTQRGDVISDDRTNAVIISDIPSVIPGIDRLLTQMDRKTQEVEIEARVVAATRSFARDLGTQLGFGWGNGHAAVGGAQSVGTTPTVAGGLTPGYITTGTGGSGTGTQIPLFSNLPVTSPSSGLSFITASNNVRVDAVLTAAESRGLLKILSRPRVVTQNNIQALVRQGVRVPIVTQAQLGGPPTVTYVDAFLRLTVVPQITSEGTIFLNVDVENTTPDFGH